MWKPFLYPLYLGMAFAWLATPLLAEQASLQGLGDLPGGSFKSAAYAISADGKVVVGESESANDSEAFRWTPENGIQSLGKLSGGGFFRHANAVSADGSVIVGWADGKRGEEAFRWTAKEGGQLLGDFGGKFSSFRSHAFGVSQDGNIVVGTASASLVGEDGGRYSRFTAFRWTKRTGIVRMESAFSFDSWSEILGVSADGRILVGDCMPPDERASVGCVWLGDTKPIPLPQSRQVPVGAFARAACNAVSSDGTAIVGENCGDAFLLVLPKKLISGQGVMDRSTERPTENGERRDGAPKPGLHRIGRLGGDSAENPPAAASAVSADGSVVVGWSGAKQGSEKAVIWDEKSGLRTISSVLTQAGVDLKGWDLIAARGVSSDGTVIVGEGRNPNNQEEAWIVRLPSQK